MEGVSGQLDWSTHIGELLNDRRICQEIFALGLFDRILLMLATFKRVNTCEVRVRLSRDAEGRDVLQERLIRPEEIIDNVWLEIRLDVEIQPSGNESFFVIVDSPEARHGDAFTLRAGQPTGGNLPMRDSSASTDKALACVLTSLPASYISRRAAFSTRDLIRKRFASKYITGIGAEVGAGAFPSLLPDSASCRYFDLRTRAELIRYFGTDQIPIPDIEPVASFGTAFVGGADFLIAHNVLEHCPDALGTLMQWHIGVKPGGHVVLSVPQAGYGPDGNRLPVSIDHVLFDYALDRDAESFESREHCYSAMIGFMKGKYQNMTRSELTKDVHRMARTSGFDIHWHIFTPEVFVEMVSVAAALQCREIEICDMAHAQQTDPALRTEGEILLCYRLGPEGKLAPKLPPSVGKAVHKLTTAINKLKGG